MCGMGCSSWGLFAAYSYLVVSAANVPRPVRPRICFLVLYVVLVGIETLLLPMQAGAKRQRLVVIILQAN